MTPAERIEKAFDDANLVIADYLQPGPRDAEESLRQLISVIDNREPGGLCGSNNRHRGCASQQPPETFSLFR
jgi:hypothetical protein